MRPISRDYPIDKILRERDRLAELMRFEAEDRPLGAERFRRLVEMLYQELPAGVDYAALHDSLRPLAGTTPTGRVLAEYAHRLAGNVHNLQLRRVARPWSYQIEWEWVPLTVARVRRDKSPSGKFGATLTFKVQAGTPAGLTAERFWSNKQCAYMARHLGFSRPPSPRATLPPKFPYVGPEQFVTLRLYGLIDPRKSGAETGPVPVQYRFPPATLAFNRTQLKYRRRGPGYECPKNLPLSLPCHRCPVGYDQCRAACHPATYEARPCPLCGAGRAPFDPDRPWPFCVNCATKAVFKKD